MNKPRTSIHYLELDSSQNLIARLREETERSYRLFDELEQSNRNFRKTYANAINSLSKGKLVLITEEEIEGFLGEPINGEYELRGKADLSRCRDIVNYILKNNFPSLAIGKCIMAIGEAMTNAVKHAEGGKFRLFRKDDVFQFMIEDSGGGINFGTMPKVAHTCGFSTTGTSGLGFTIMLEQCRKLFLSSRPGKTILVLETDL